MSDQSDVTVKLDDRVRLLSAILAVTDYPEKAQKMKPHGTHYHARATNKHLANHRSHPAVQATQSLLDQNTPLEAIFALVMLNRGDLIELSTIGLIFVYFILAYFMFASLMAAIGSAVNDLREAQSLMTPVIMLMMLPYIFFMPVIRAPSSMLSVVLSFIPPVSPFIMIMRVASTDPPPVWQVALSIAVNAVAVVFFLWLAAKIFRVGLLMFGKPPNLRTLVKWVRMA